MSWTPITGKADYTNGLTVSYADVTAVGTRAIDPVLNTGGTQDYSTYMQGNSANSITPDPGNSGLTAPMAGPNE